MARLFISYSRKDIETARKLTKAFEGQGLDFWIDWEGIPPTVDWWKEIEKGIEEADIFLFLISPDSAKSRVCRQEIEHAAKNGKRLIPVMVRGIKAEESPTELRPLNWIFIRESDDFNLGFSRLISAIKTDYAWVQAHRQLQVKALEWERSNRENSFLLRGKELQDAEFQLAMNSSKEPNPTDLQREYVFTSRRATDQQRRRTTSISIAGIISLAALAVFGLVQTRLARNAQADAEVNLSAAQTAQSQSNERAIIARTGELAAQSEALRDENFQISLLLAIEAFNTRDTIQTRGALMGGIYANPQLRAFLSSRIDHGTRPVTNVTFSPDGKTLSADVNGIILWDVASGQIISQPRKSGSNIDSGVISPDGKLVASSQADGSIILWDMETAQSTGQLLSGYQGQVESIAFSPNGKTLASVSGVIILWDIDTGRPIGQPLSTRIGQREEVLFSPDGKILASFSDVIILWDIETGQPIGQPLDSHTHGINSIAFSPNGKILASATDTLVLWDMETRQPIDQPPGGADFTAYCVAFSPDGKTLASGQLDGTIVLWDVETRQPIGQPFRGHAAGSVNSIDFSPDGFTLASGGDDENIILWDVTTVLNQTPEKRLSLTKLLRGHSFGITSADFSPDGKTLASGSDVIILWDVETGQPIGQPLGGYPADLVNSVVFSPDGKILASGHTDDTILLWHVETRRLIGQPLNGHPSGVSSLAFSPDGKTGVSNLAFSPDGKMLASGSGDATIILWDVDTGLPIGKLLSKQQMGVSSIAFSPDGKMLASGSWDSTIILWNVETRQPISQPLRSGGNINSVAFSPDGRALASGGWTMILWDITTINNASAETVYTIGQPLSAYRNLIRTIAFSPDGRTLASGSLDDNTIILWDAVSNQPIGNQPLNGHTDEVTVVTFSPDGKTLASGSSDKIIILWDIDPLSWIQKSCQRVGRNFVEFEWKTYFPNEEYRKTCKQWPLETETTPTPISTP